MCNLLYCKYFVNELVFIDNVPNYIFLQYTDRKNYIPYIKMIVFLLIIVKMQILSLSQYL